MMKKTVWALLTVFFLAAFSLYAESKPRIAPPPARAEEAKIRPSPNHVWTTGYWKWTGVNYAWVEGRWIKAKPGRVWVAGAWTLKGSYWEWTAGRWEKIKTDKPEKPKKNKKDKK
jgi:hypothetical protein